MRHTAIASTSPRMGATAPFPIGEPVPATAAARGPQRHDPPPILTSTAGQGHVRRLRAVARKLWPQADDLARGVIEAIGLNHPTYHDHVAQDAAIPEVEESVRLGLLAVAAPSMFVEETMRRWSGFGVAGAEVGIPLDMMLTCHRILSATVWSAVSETAQAAEQSSVEALLGVSAEWWRLQDRQSAAIASSYLATVAELSTPHAEHARAMIDALLDGRVGLTNLPAAARTLDLPIRGAYVVAVTDRPTDPADRPRLTVGPDVDVQRVLWRRQPQGDLAVILLGDRRPERLGDLVEPSRHARIGISPVVGGLGELDEAHRLAAVAARTCEKPGEVAVLDERLPAALVASAPDIAWRLARQVIGPILDLEPRHRDLLLHTLGVWLDCGGSTDIAGRRLYCHRNTVLNRVRRIEHLCGRELTGSQSPVLFSLALDAYRLAGSADDRPDQPPVDPRPQQPA